MFRSGLARVLFLTIFALVAGAIGYQIGLGTHVAESGATVVYAGGFGFGGFGFLFFLFIVGLILFSFGGRRRAWGGHGAWGPGYGRGWGGPVGPGGDSAASGHVDPRRQWVADMHRSLHEADARAAEGASPSGPSGAASS